MPVIDTFNGALTLNQRVFTEMRDAPDGVRRGFLIILMVGLLVGVFQSASALISVTDPERVVQDVLFSYRQSLEQQQATATTAEQREVIRLLQESEDELAEMVRGILAVPTTLPRPVALILQALGQIASTPLNYLSNMLLAVVFTHLAARQLGGQGGIRAMVAVGSLSVAPHALDALTFVPVLSFPISMIAWGWGLIILVSGTAIVHRLDSGKAALAVLLYPSLLIVLAVLLGCMLGVLFVTALAGIG
ncbi:MAG: YIP1 family protein [Chloroflexus sp.]|nr:YIP1 family protein [Chloroflexus sp.]